MVGVQTITLLGVAFKKMKWCVAQLLNYVTLGIAVCRSCSMGQERVERSCLGLCWELILVFLMVMRSNVTSVDCLHVSSSQLTKCPVQKPAFADEGNYRSAQCWVVGWIILNCHWQKHWPGLVKEINFQFGQNLVSVFYHRKHPKLFVFISPLFDRRTLHSPQAIALLILVGSWKVKQLLLRSKWLSKLSFHDHFKLSVWVPKFRDVECLLLRHVPAVSNSMTWALSLQQWAVCVMVSYNGGNKVQSKSFKLRHLSHKMKQDNMRNQKH